MRFEKAITQDLLEGMARGGCRMILFGLETASDRMIELMDKGTKRATMSRILKESTRAGIWNHTFFFFGFPTETLDDAQDTVNFVFEHGDVIHSGSPGEFVLERYSPVHQQPAKYGVRRIIQKPEQDLAIYFEYVLESGLDEQTAKVHHRTSARRAAGQALRPILRPGRVPAALFGLSARPGATPSALVDG